METKLHSILFQHLFVVHFKIIFMSSSFGPYINNIIPMSSLARTDTTKSLRGNGSARRGRDSASRFCRRSISSAELTTTAA